MARGLKELLAYEGNVEEDLCLNFHVSIEEFGKVITVNLRENGEHVAVTNDNRDEYVRLYLDWILNTAIYEQVRAFYLGFHTLGASNALLVSPRQRPPERTIKQMIILKLRISGLLLKYEDGTFKMMTSL